MNDKKNVTGNILLFYAFDVGDEINLKKIRQKNLIQTYKFTQSPHFKAYHIPLIFRLFDKVDEKVVERQDALLNKIHHFGVVSICYKIPFDCSLDQLKEKVVSITKKYEEQSEVDMKKVFKKINPAIDKPHFYNLKNDYLAIHVNPTAGKMSPEDFKDKYGSKIASLMRLETEVLSEYQQDEILSSVTGYYGQDLMIIDSGASFIYDDEYFEPMEFFESANIEQLELQYFDRFLDQRLNYFYQQKPHKLPLTAYIPLVGRRDELPATRLARLRVDISVTTERLRNSIKMTGDAYYEKLYSMLVDKLSLEEWRNSINKKLEIIEDLHKVHQNHLDTVNDEMLTFVIIVLIVIEIVVAVSGIK